MSAPGAAGAPAAGGGMVVIGVGNEFRHDDAVGVAVLEALRAGPPLGADVRLVACDGEPSRMLDAWAGTTLAVVVDAVRMAEPEPGRVHRATLEDEPAPAQGASSHGLGVLEAVELAQALDRLPGQLVCYAVEAADVSLGLGLSEPVRAAVRPLAERIAADLRAARSNATP